jgi:hypothetical protein
MTADNVRAPSPAASAPAGGLTTGLRAWLERVADELIPADGAMPAASTADPAGRQLDAVMRVRPDLLDGLLRAHRMAGDAAPSRVLDHLSSDPAAREALLLVVAGGYYSSPLVIGLLGYTGQTPEPVRVDGYPRYVAEDLLDRVVARGPIYRPTVESIGRPGTGPARRQEGIAHEPG